MASLRSGLRPPPGGDTVRTRRVEGIATQSPVSQSSSRTRPPPRELDNFRTRPSAAPVSSFSSLSGPLASRSSSSSRIPQTSSGLLPVSPSPRRPSDSRQKSRARPPLTHQSQSWGTAVNSTIPVSPDRNATSPSTFAPRHPRNTSANLSQTSRILSKDNHTEKQTKTRPRNNSEKINSSSSSTQPTALLELDRGLTESPAELRVARRAEVTSAHTVTIYPELDRYRTSDRSPYPTDPHGPMHPDILFRLATEKLPAPPTPHLSGSNSLASGISGSPSTRFSDSPGPGAYSRDTTPTSMSSQSPGLMTSVRMPSTPRIRQPTRIRAGSFGKDSSNGHGESSSSVPQTLTAIRESLNSSSSSSAGTVRGVEKKDKIKKKRLSPLPPSPPPRKSSQKFKVSVDEDESLSKQRRNPEELTCSHPFTASSKTYQTKESSTSPMPAISKEQRQRDQTTTSPRPPQRTIPPARPSRDGTPDLHSQVDFTLPTIQSNLAYAPSPDHNVHAVASTSSRSGQYFTLYDQHQPSSPLFPQTADRQDDVLFPAYRTDDAVHTHPAKSAAASSSSSHVALSPKTEPVEEPRPGREYGTSARTPSPNVSAFRARFPLFTRRIKPVPAKADPVPVTDKIDSSLARRGPVAGTGHEGYGRMGSSRRRSSSVSNFFRTTVSSQESLVSPQFQDPFLRDRLSPVVIAGGEIIENQNMGYDLARTGSNTSASASASAGAGCRRPSTHCRADSVSSREDRTTLWPSAIPRGSRRPSDSSDSEAVMKSTLAFRRSVQRLRSADQAQVRVPKPIVVRPPRYGAPSSINSIDTSVMTDDSVQSGHPEPTRGRKGSSSNGHVPAAKKLTKRPRSPRKWNLFGRSQSQPAISKKALQSTSTVAVTVETAPPAEQSKPVAFYAMIDSSEQEDGDMDVEDILREARVLGSPVSLRSNEQRVRRPSTSQVSVGSDTPSRPSRELQVSQSQVPLQPSVAPKRPQYRQFSETQPQLQQQRMQQRSASSTRLTRQSHEQAQPPTTKTNPVLPTSSAARPGRPSRLPQVGRIPKVISSRPEQTSPKSFSRPFNRTNLQLPSSASTLLGSLNTGLIANGPSPPKSSTPELMHNSSAMTGGSTDPMTNLQMPLNLSPDADSVGDGVEFFSLSSRKDSQTTSGTSSSGILSFANATAIVPDLNAPLVEDEIWDEYNDLLGEEALKVPPSATSSRGMPFYLEPETENTPILTTHQGQTTKHLERIKAKPSGTSTVVDNFQKNKNINEYIRIGRTAVASSVYSNDFTAQNIDIYAEQRVSALSQLPPTPFSVSEFVSGYGDRNNSGIKIKQQVTSQRSSVSSQRGTNEKMRVSDSSVYSQISEDNSPISQVNLRVGSMTVSKWLTFGHVLFSPARDDMVLAASPPNGHSVLVIDGLGNDDWSFYAAETYPAATFFNLSPRAPLPIDHQSGTTAFPISPPNHHQIQFGSNADKLPFQSEIFTTVVYRFPEAAPESHYKNIINEARRVLKPGGYLELSILDLDLNNMGNRTRRTIRRLKEQVHEHAPDMHLGSTADVILRLLGSRGFTDIKSCRVGIPVASPISQASSDDASAGGEKRTTPPKDKPMKDQRSLAEMINDESTVADESITNMVARVGRWWHSRCYGDAAVKASLRLAHKARSSDMWMDRALLAECEEWRTTLKLMVCYARVSDTKRVASI